MLVLGGACSLGGGCLFPGGSAAGGRGGDHPGRLLLRAVRILLESILVFFIFLSSSPKIRHLRQCVLKLHSDRGKANAKAKIFFDV